MPALDTVFSEADIDGMVADAGQLNPWSTNKRQEVTCILSFRGGLGVTPEDVRFAIAQSYFVKANKVPTRNNAEFIVLANENEDTDADFVYSGLETLAMCQDLVLNPGLVEKDGEMTITLQWRQGFAPIALVAVLKNMGTLGTDFVVTRNNYNFVVTP